MLIVGAQTDSLKVLVLFPALAPLSLVCPVTCQAMGRMKKSHGTGGKEH